MRKLYFLLTHFDADRAVRFNVRLLSEYSTPLYRHGFESHVMVLSTGTGLKPGNGEELFVPLPNLGHAAGDMEMINLGVVLALGRGADLVVKLSGNRMFLNPEKLITLLDRLEHSDKGMLCDHWITDRDYATDIIFLKAWFAELIIPIQVLGTPAICETRLARRVKQHGLEEQVLLYDERQPIHGENGRRSFYEELEILSNVDNGLEAFIRRSYPEYIPLLESDLPLIEPSPLNWVCGLRPAADPRLVLTRGTNCYELYGMKGKLVATLNDSAAMTWTRCDGQNTTLDICAAVESELGLEQGATISDVRETIARFLADGLLRIQ